MKASVVVRSWCFRARRVGVTGAEAAARCGCCSASTRRFLRRRAPQRLVRAFAVVTRATGCATITQTSSMAEVMRASRTVENEVIIAPAHVTASAILHAYQLLATSGQEQTYVLVAKNSIDSVDKLVGKRIYMPQQDSLRSYVAKGLLVESGVKLAQFSKVTYGNTSGGGLVALSFDVADVTVADEAQAKAWIASNPGQARILKTTRRPRRHGWSSARTSRHRLPASATGSARSEGSIRRGPFPSRSADPAISHLVARSQHTPDLLKGVTRVSAEEVAELAKQNVTSSTRAARRSTTASTCAARSWPRTSRRA